ncbi:thiopurine S-methyltransferase [Salinisphaera aquimarina]|uniref:Thiopurine S-methyltransferase n=1 Tax=Salinisphaera aquimarina TaxID=2094031 RepID=A0ABV7EUU2_9GAMM
MNRDFWLDRWDNQQIGFHQPQGQPLLAEWWSTLGLAEGTSVLVPLCGKTPDMLWLAAQGHTVTGVEFSDRAARDFLAEQQLDASRDDIGRFVRYRSGAIELLVGDFFDLDADRIAAHDAVYDRAALIALPPALRADYSAHLLAALRPGATIFLIALDYGQREMQGPPFAVSDAEVQRLYGDACDVAMLCERDALAPGDHLSSKGVSQACERVYRLTRR